MNPEEFGKYIKELRIKRDLTLEKLGEEVGFSKSYLSHIENGKRGIPSPEVLFKLTKPLGVDHVHLMIKAGHLPEDEKDILETDYENNLREKESEQRRKEWQEKDLLRNDLKVIIQKPETNYSGKTLSEIDRKRILDMLNVLFSDKN